MPIAVQCSCGQKLNVPDQMAGKQGKCPKCQQLLRIPAAAAPAGNAPKAASAPQKAPAPAPDPGLASLLEEAGVGKKSGVSCPRCDAPIQRGAVLCTKCGLNLATGEQLQQVQTEKEFSYGNFYLDEAVVNMKRDDKVQDNHDKAGIPWYVIATLLAVILLIGSGMVLVVDSQLMGAQPEGTLIGTLQKFPLQALIGGIVGIAAMILNFIAVVITLVHAFRNNVVNGLLVMFCPFYIFVYQIMNWDELKGPFFSLILASVLGGVAGGLIGASLAGA